MGNEQSGPVSDLGNRLIECAGKGDIGEVSKGLAAGKSSIQRRTPLFSIANFSLV